MKNVPKERTSNPPWAYRLTVKTSIRETPFKLAYGSETVIPAEIHMANHRMMKYKDEENEEQLLSIRDLRFNPRLY